MGAGGRGRCAACYMDSHAEAKRHGHEECRVDGLP
ncbi:MAG: hypothetical protein HUU41_17040 [Bryobacteraceae bacterium]|nr:hypothetical protein [Bryobacterales bacterium]NUN02818.1 hypothetical protein [Bryobacteraceae bacterium]